MDKKKSFLFRYNSNKFNPLEVAGDRVVCRMLQILSFISTIIKKKYTSLAPKSIDLIKQIFALQAVAKDTVLAPFI